MTTAIIIWLACGIISASVASQKGRSGCGWFLVGFLLGPLGLIFALVSGNNKKENEVIHQHIVPERRDDSPLKKCPFCAEMIKLEAIVCRYCGRDLETKEPEKISLPKPSEFIHVKCEGCGKGYKILYSDKPRKYHCKVCGREIIVK